MDGDYLILPVTPRALAILRRFGAEEAGPGLARVPMPVVDLLFFRFAAAFGCKVS